MVVTEAEQRLTEAARTQAGGRWRGLCHGVRRPRRARDLSPALAWGVRGLSGGGDCAAARQNPEIITMLLKL